ncbi:lipopolysaccharide biosynthesis protein [Variovorax sp. RB2P76]|uniref:lipopolysaccharide biosynthesis protein n=1 Tax=Variovorax sp. RB2P76 TaxID=3443736 RepID=UPI003F45CF97
MSIRQVVLMMRSRLESLNRVGFVRSVGVLVGGTAFAQGLAILILPIVTRLYTPADFSALAVFASILSIVSVAACLRLEIAIPLPDSDEDAANLLASALAVCTVVSALVAFVIWCFYAKIIELIGQPELQPHLWLLPVGIWLASAYSAIQFWSTRKKRFGTIAKTRMTQALGGIGTQVGLGWMGFAPFGLLLGQVIASGAGLFGLSSRVIREDRSAFKKVRWIDMRRLLRRYERFPRYSTFEAFANSAGIQLPIIVIASVAIGAEAGYLMLGMRVIGAPMALIGGSVSQVYLSRAPSELRAGTLTSFTLQITRGLVKTGGGPLLFAGIIAPIIFPILFGENWRRAGEIVIWMTPWFVLQFLTSPVSMVLHVTENQRVAMILQLVGLALRVGAVLAASWLAGGLIVKAYAISGFLFYCIYFCVLGLILKISRHQFVALIRDCVKFLLPWALLGLVVNLIYNYLTLAR